MEPTTSIATASSTGVVPLFPLPGICLLPGELLPLYVFEARYRAMLEDALRGESLIAMARLHRAADGLLLGADRCCGVGRIIVRQAHPDGTSSIVLRGIARVQIGELLASPRPYRLARVLDLPEKVADAALLEARVREIEALVLEALPDLDFGPHAIPVHELPGRLAGPLGLDSAARQRILETDDLAERVAPVLRVLRALVGQRRCTRVAETLATQNLSVN